jgi:hypothetical protein
MKLYIHSVDNLTEARFACASNADFLGFRLTPGQAQYIDPVKLSAITPWLSGPLLVGQFLFEPVKMILTQVEILGLQLVEIPASHPDRKLLRQKIPLIIHFEDNHSDFQIYENEIALIQSDMKINHPENALVHVNADIKNILKSFPSNAPLGLAFAGQSESEPGMAELSHWSEWLEEIGWEGY